MIHKSPYPGLRPFTEDEAIFFRGREAHVFQIIKSLEEKRFVMITGASGDGKSSIVYAGLVPKAKAGFFKARFNNWKVYDFRPEKSPFENMCVKVAEALKMDKVYVKKELSYGFSSLVNLYKKSDLYYEENGNDFEGLSAEQRVEKKRGAGNLLLIVDQFEEFFTNTENLNNGSPNDSSHLVANLLSHTVQIAKEQNLPIYVVFTMRSDYIGNCASLRGVPELIGYSQYFIPRLNREEIADVVRDPADLNGDKIQNRLVDHLINSTTEGADQLPIIQHCMNRIWRSADGNDLDLYHLALCQGLKSEDLPKEQQELPEIKSIPKSSAEKSLNNVINAHASNLFEQSIEYFITKHPKFKKEDVEENLISLMKSLAKMDNGKGVRYKVIFGELVSNLKYPMNLQQANDLIFLFRKEGNDLLAPYSNQIEILKENDPLEISHESLIRNWIRLKKWVVLDTQDYQTFQDLKGQSSKWEENQRSNNYLLGIGPLDYFDKWFKVTNPSVFWIMKYEQLKNSEINIKDSISGTLEQIKLFLAESRSAIKKAQQAEKRRRKVLLIAVSIAVLVLSSITVWAFREKSLADSAKKVAQTEKKNAELATQEAIKSEEKALYLSALSDSSLKVSEENEKLANQAKSDALQQKSIAESSKIFAQKQAKIAKDESNKALIALDQLLEQKSLTESQRDSANIARMEAYELSMQSISTSLALQASRVEIKPELAGLMAFHANEFNNSVNGSKKSPAIFSGSTSALSKLKGNDYNLLDELKFMPNDLLVDDNEKNIYAIDNEGFVDIWNFKDGFFKGPKHKGTTKLNSNFEGLSANAFLLEKSSMAFVDLEGNLSYFESLDKTSPTLQFSNHSSIIRKVIKNGNKLISGGGDGKIIIQSIDGDFTNKEIPIEGIVLDISILNSKIVIITRGKCLVIDLESEYQLKEISLSGGLRSCSVSKEKIIISNNKGEIFQLNENLVITKKIQFGYFPIGKIEISPDGNTLAIASANRRIGIYNLTNLEQDPMIIDNVGFQIRTLAISNDGFLIAGLENGDCRFWSTNISQNITEICANLTRSLTKDEWEKYIGNKIEYNEACKK